LILVLGVRGGVGATTIATNAAWYLAETLRRHTVLLDLDLKAGDTALQLDAMPTHALWEALSHPERIDKLYLERAVKPLTERLHLLASLEPLTSGLAFDEEAAIALIEKLSIRYRFVVVDLPRGTAIGMKRLLILPHTLVVVANASLAAARDVSRWSEVLGENTAERSTIYLLNRTSPHGGLEPAEFLSASGKSPNVAIPYDRSLAEAAPLGIKAMQNCSTFRRSLTGFLRQLTGEAEQAPASLLSRILAR
jgi:pilus assembly protein CpaE